MRHFPIFLDTKGRRVVVSGAQDCAVAKLRLLVKTQAQISVFGADPAPQLQSWAAQGRVQLHERALTAADLDGAQLLYAANDAPIPDHAAFALGRAAGVPTLVVDDLEHSDFITPAIVDRSPITVAIGTEGTAPVLARHIKSQIEAMLPVTLGRLARIGQAFRPKAALLPPGRPRREFWTRFYLERGPRALAKSDEAAQEALDALWSETKSAAIASGHVDFVGAGPGDPELLTQRARKLLHEADVVIHDRLVSAQVLELARREATRIEVGKTGFGPSWCQDDINKLLVQHGREARVVRLKSGDGGIFGRLDEEIAAIEAAQISYAVTPGITAAAAAAASLGASLTQRGRNGELRLITAQQAKGLADHDWNALARPGAVAAIYMGKRAAHYLRGRLLMHGATGATPISIVENASRADQRIIGTTLLSLPDELETVQGPAVLLLGIAPRQAKEAHHAQAI